MTNEKKPRETERQDIWFNAADTERIERIAAEMKRNGIDPNGRYGKINTSKVVRWSLEQTVKILEILDNS